MLEYSPKDCGGATLSEESDCRLTASLNVLRNRYRRSGDVGSGIPPKASDGERLDCNECWQSRDNGRMM